MAFREVSVVQVKEALRRWLRGEGERPIAQGVGIDRKTVRRYIAAAVELGVERCGGEEQLGDELIGQVLERVRPHRPDGHGEAWRTLLGEEERIKDWLKDDLTVTKIGILLARRGVVVPPRTLARFCCRALRGREEDRHRPGDRPAARARTPGRLRRLGLIPDGERRRVCQGLIFTACSSRHQFVWPTFLQTTEEVIRGFEAAWSYFGGVFPVVIPDNMKSIVIVAEHTAPRINDTFMEYAQSRGFVIDAARVATPTDKPRVERVVHYVQHNFFAGESFIDLADCRVRAETWCSVTAGMRIHGTTQCRPIEAFRTEELPLLLPAARRALRHAEVVRSQGPPRLPCRSRQGDLLGVAPPGRADAALPARLDDVKLYLKGELVKVHPRQPPGARITDPADMPKGTEIYATRDIARLGAMAADHGPSIGLYATAILDTPLPWTKMRQVYRLLALVKKWGPERVELACARALEAEAVDVNLVSRMLERAREDAEPGVVPRPVVIQGRFARDPSEFASVTETGR